MLTTETVPNVTGHHFFNVFVPSYFLIANMRFATEEFFLLCILAVAQCSTGLGLGLNILVLFPSLNRARHSSNRLPGRHSSVRLKVQWNRIQQGWIQRQGFSA